MTKYDFFLAHAGSDKENALKLFKLLKVQSKVFLDSECLLPGDPWPDKLQKAQMGSRVTVVIISRNTDKAYYQKEEIAKAIKLARSAPDRHRVVPVFLDEESEASQVIPYGLQHLHSIYFTSAGSLKKIAELLLSVLDKPHRTQWENYEQLFAIEFYDIAYVPIINPFGNKPKLLKINEVEVLSDGKEFILPDQFSNTTIPLPAWNDPSCRLSRYSYTENEDIKLRISISKTSYLDYLKSGEHLDDPLPDNPEKTYRDEFGKIAGKGSQSLRPFKLTNICGAGLFVVSKDNCIVASYHSQNSHVYPGRLTFSASGIMKWGAYPHPFTEIIRKTFEEISHQVNPSNLSLIGFGVDARKLYSQFSFIEWANENVKDIEERSEKSENLVRIPLDPDDIVAKLLSECWEPAAEAAILTLCQLRFPQNQIISALKAKEYLWQRKIMQDEWDHRSTRMGDLADMSVRYPVNKVETESKDYVNAVLRFIGPHSREVSILEAGCGTGRMTIYLADQATILSAVDLCPRMLERNKQRLGERANVQYFEGFIQDMLLPIHDLAVCSQVLIHNTKEEEFSSVVRKLCNSAKNVFVFEDVSHRFHASPHTKLRSQSVIISEFKKNNFSIIGQKEYKLFDDVIAFFHFRNDEISN